jgi:hypothetical protein
MGSLFGYPKRVRLERTATYSGISLINCRDMSLNIGERPPETVGDMKRMLFTLFRASILEDINRARLRYASAMNEDSLADDANWTVFGAADETTPFEQWFLANCTPTLTREDMKDGAVLSRGTRADVRLLNFDYVGL